MSESTWHAERKTLIGASESPSILGVGYETAADVWRRKVGIAGIDEETERMTVGTVIQPALIELARRKIGLPFVEEEHVLRRSSAVPHVGASLDAYVLDDDQIIPLEVKNVDGIRGKEWADEPPIGYQVQLQQQLFVTGAAYGYVFALIGGNRTVWHRVERNDVFISALLRRLAWFWDLVVSKKAPDFVDADDQSRTLAALYPQDSGTAIALPDGADKTVEEIAAFGRVIESAEEEKKALQNQLRELLGENAFGVTPGGKWVSLKTQHRKEYTTTVKATSYRVLRYHEKRPKDAPEALLPHESGRIETSEVN